jgi:spermidine synthase
MTVNVSAVLCEFRSQAQHVVIADTEEFGRCLVIDDVMQASMLDNDLYDAELLRFLDDADRRFVILGGGDGFVARRILEKIPSAEIVVADLDPEVTRAVETWFDQDVFRSERVDLQHRDAVEVLRNLEPSVDGIICDLTDSPVGVSDLASFEAFYRQVIRQAARLLRPSGWISIQAGASSVAPGCIDQAAVLEGLLYSAFGEVERTDAHLPSYGEACAFLFAMNKRACPAAGLE